MSIKAEQFNIPAPVSTDLRSPRNSPCTGSDSSVGLGCLKHYLPPGVEYYGEIVPGWSPMLDITASYHGEGTSTGIGDMHYGYYFMGRHDDGHQPFSTVSEDHKAIGRYGTLEKPFSMISDISIVDLQHREDNIDTYNPPQSGSGSWLEIGNDVLGWTYFANVPANLYSYSTTRYIFKHRGGYIDTSSSPPTSMSIRLRCDWACEAPGPYDSSPYNHYNETDATLKITEVYLSASTAPSGTYLVKYKGGGMYDNDHAEYSLTRNDRHSYEAKNWDLFKFKSEWMLTTGSGDNVDKNITKVIYNRMEKQDSFGVPGFPLPHTGGFVVNYTSMSQAMYDIMPLIHLTGSKTPLDGEYGTPEAEEEYDAYPKLTHNWNIFTHKGDGPIIMNLSPYTNPEVFSADNPLAFSFYRLYPKFYARDRIPPEDNMTYWAGSRGTFANGSFVQIYFNSTLPTGRVYISSSILGETARSFDPNLNYDVWHQPILHGTQFAFNYGSPTSSVFNVHLRFFADSQTEMEYSSSINIPFAPNLHQITDPTLIVPDVDFDTPMLQTLSYRVWKFTNVTDTTKTWRVQLYGTNTGNIPTINLKTTDITGNGVTGMRLLTGQPLSSQPTPRTQAGLDTYYPVTVYATYGYYRQQICFETLKSVNKVTLTVHSSDGGIPLNNFDITVSVPDEMSVST